MTSWFRGRGAAATPPAGTPPGPAGGSTPSGQGVPLELISYDQNTGKFKLGAEALEALKRTRGPVGVVAVCGRARQGKSFILNQVLGRTGGFQVAPTHRPCTKGLWMWSAPVEHRGPDGSPYSLVLLDTEGIDAYDQTGQYSTQIFSLAVLLSSLFVFNQMGGIDEAALDRLSLVTEMTKHIRVRASGGNDDSASELASFTPKFLWLLRDFYLRLEEDGRQVTPRDYLETALQPLHGTGRAVEAKNQIRESIKSLFPDRDCFTLVRPVNDEDELARLDELPSGQMRPEFREGLHRLTQLIFSKAQPKRLGTQILSGPMLAGLTEAYVTAINNGAVPTIATAWQGVAEAESRRASDAAVAAYTQTFREDVPTEEAPLEAEHQHALMAAQKAFGEIAIGDPEVRKANDTRWREACHARFAQLRDRKLAQAAAACEKLINEATVRLAALARQEGATVERMQEEVAAFEQSYKASPAASGPTKWPRFAEFLRDAYGGAVRDLSARIEERRKAEAAAAAQQAEVARLQAQQAEARLATAEAGVTQLRQQAGELERQLREAQAELARERAAVAASATRIATLEQQVQHLSQSKEAEARSLGQQAQAQLAAAQAAAASEAAALRAAQSDAGREAQQAQQALAAAQTELASLRQQVAASGAAAQGASGRLAALEAEKEGLSNSVQMLAADKAELQRAKEAADRALVDVQQRMKAREADLKAQLRAKEEEALRAAQAAAAAPPPRVAAAAYDEPAPMEDAGGDEFEDAENLPNISKMTIPQMKDWLMEHGREADVWTLASKKGKKADFEKLMREVTGQL
ncbi:interferon-induced guanylate-binding 1-like [Micractinium conductrix]|uniref:Interferon-induced guanylate-binding 1-like n=1 Tax=Micractinium conductrix TaxID=554055 RepID=A0A2P6VQF9_9CHLO|nr:interferon-induced guanylate-binding 1-like [Micractinium conductrix]|eukprot:PSC76322.1 interferon-induced guanylate-binding 1-like [Micractinium conductrix]